MRSASKAHPLTPSFIDALRRRDRARDFTDFAIRGLVLRVEPSGRKHWLFRFKLKKKPCRMPLGEYSHNPLRLPNGEYSALTLTLAREQAAGCRAFLASGIDPRMARKSPPTAGRPAVGAAVVHALTEEPLEAAVDEVVIAAYHPHSIEFLIFEFKRLFVQVEREDPEYVNRILDREVSPYFRGRDARTIAPREIVEFLDTIVARGSKVMANRIATIVGQLFLFGVHRSIVAASPVQLLLKPGGQEKSRKRIFSNEELQIFVVDYRKGARTRILAHMLKIYLLTAARRGELCKAKKSDVNLDRLEWYIPEDVAKNREACIIPLSEAAAAEFRALFALSGDSDYVVPRRGQNASLPSRHLTRRVARCQGRFQKLGIAPFRAHDFRRTCRTFLSKLGVPPHIAERVLNHKRKGIEGVYDLFEFLAEKREALNKWAKYLAEIEAQVTTARIAVIRSTPTVLAGRALSEAELRSFVLHYRKATRTRSLAHLTKILLLTGAEAQELARARWPNIDLEAGLWRIAPNETADREAFIMPLTRSAIEEFAALMPVSGHTEYVIPYAKRNAPVKPGYLAHRLRRCQKRFEHIGVVAFMPSDLQVTCRETLLRLGVTSENANRLFKRMPAGVVSQRMLYEDFEEKRSALERWEAFLLSMGRGYACNPTEPKTLNGGGSFN